jgi:integrase
MGKLRRRGQTYWADFQTRDGRRVRVSLRTSDLKVAKDRLRDAELVPSDQASHAPARLLAAALDYLVTVGCNDRAPATRRFYTQKAQNLLRLIGNVPIDGKNALDRTRVAAYAKQRIDEGAHPHTVGKELICLRRALKEQHDIRPLPRAPGDVIPKWSSKYTPVTRYLTPEQFAKLLDVAPADRRLWLVLVVYTGANLGETEKISTEGIDLVAGQLRIPGTKRQSRNRVVPIPDPLRPWLAAELARRAAAGAPHGPLVGRWNNVRRALTSACSRAAVPRVTPNDLRRTYASWLKQAGVDSRAVADLMGHSSTRMVDQVYGRLTPEVYARAVAALPAIAPAGRQLAAAAVERHERELARRGAGAAHARALLDLIDLRRAETPQN